MKPFFLAAALMAATSIAHADGTRTNGTAEIIVPGGKDNSIAYRDWHFAPAVKVGNVIYASGVAGAPVDGDQSAAFHNIWQGINRVLNEAGASLDDVVEFTSYHVGIHDQIADFSAVKDEYIKEPYPAWTAVGVNALALEGLITEVKVVAVIGETP